MRPLGVKVRLFSGESYFILAKDLGYLDNNQQLLDDAEAISRMLFRLIESINQRQ